MKKLFGLIAAFVLAASVAYGQVGGGVYVPSTSLTGANVRTALTPTTSAQWAAMTSDETGTGLLVFNNGGTFIAPVLGTPASVTLTNGTGLPEGGLSLTDITTGNVSATAHGFAPKFPNNTTTFFRGDGTYATLNVAAVSGAAPLASPTFTGTVTLPDTSTWSSSLLTLNNGGNSTQQLILSPNSGGNYALGMANTGSQLLMFSGGTAVHSFAATVIGIRSDASYAWSSTTNVVSTKDTFISRGGVATTQFGAANAASPVAQTISFQGARPGTDTNAAAAAATIIGSLGTGNGAIASLILQSGVAVGSGSATHTATTGLTISNGTAVTKGYAIASLPATATGGARAHVTDALNSAACVFFAAITAGGSTVCPVFYNGSAWVGG